MTGKERVAAALARREPAEVPFAWGFGATSEMTAVLEQYCVNRSLSWPKLKGATGDILWVGPDYTGNTTANIWGINQRNVSYGDGSYDEFVDFPLAGFENPAQLAKYPWPDPLAYDYRNFRKQLLANPLTTEKAVLLAGGNPFEIYCWMTGLAEAMVNLLVNPELVNCALTHITDFFARKIELAMNEAGDLIDLVFLADDLGSQNGLLFSRDTYRAILQPHHRRLAETIKRANPRTKVMFHTDGAVFDILPDLIDAGIEVHEAVQTDAAGMQPERLKTTYGDRLCFHGAISVQALLPHGNPEQVSQECARLVQVLGQNGGYIPAPAHAIQVGTPPENVFAMLTAVLGEERFAKCLAAAKL